MFAVMEDLAILLAAVMFNAGYAATRGGYSGTMFLVSAGVLVIPTAVIAVMEGLCRKEKQHQTREQKETKC